jgi:hypothetical protein
MFETVQEPVKVLASFSTVNNQTHVLPHAMEWRGRRYRLDTMGLYHPARRGKRFLHVLEFSSGSTKFQLELDAETLIWNLTEVYYDGPA